MVHDFLRIELFICHSHFTPEQLDYYMYVNPNTNIIKLHEIKPMSKEMTIITYKLLIALKERKRYLIIFETPQDEITKTLMKVDARIRNLADRITVID